MASTKRRLAGILFSDIVGYTALMAESEQRTRISRSLSMMRGLGTRKS